MVVVDEAPPGSTTNLSGNADIEKSEGMRLVVSSCGVVTRVGLKVVTTFGVVVIEKVGNPVNVRVWIVLLFTDVTVLVPGIVEIRRNVVREEVDVVEVRICVRVGAGARSPKEAWLGALACNIEANIGITTNSIVNDKHRIFLFGNLYSPSFIEQLCV